MRLLTDPGLALCLPLYEPDGASFPSRDACGHQCLVTGAAWTPHGRSFDGTNDKINCGNPASLKPGGNRSFVVWLKGAETTGAAARNAFEIHADGDNRGYLSWPAGGATFARYYAKIGGVSYSGFDPVAAVDLGWHHFAITFEGASWKAYYDGNPVLAAEKGDHGNLTGTPTVSVGGGYNGYFKGCIGEVYMYRRPLTPGEVQESYLTAKWRYR